MKTISKTIDNIPIIVRIKKGSKEIIYHLPQGMMNYEFVNFKEKNKLVINELIHLCDEREEELEHKETDPVFPEQGALEIIPNDSNIQGDKYIAGCDPYD